MPVYEVRPGFRFGMGKKLGPGDKVELSVEEAQGFLDKLRLVEAEAPDDPDAGGDDGEKAPSGAGGDVDWAGVTGKALDALIAAGWTPERVKAATDEELLAIENIGPAALKVIREAFPAEA